MWAVSHVTLTTSSPHGRKSACQPGMGFSLSLSGREGGGVVLGLEGRFRKEGMQINQLVLSFSVAYLFLSQVLPFVIQQH